eukprot:m.66507 g.66507  ORF g.66507 m.66507 type:complete len:242 (+) comp12651_c0_seq1:2109-2834(+)
MAISWHQDPHVVKNSTIAVYVSTPEQEPPSAGYKVVFRRLDDESGAPVVIEPGSGSAYLMLGAFNATHQHGVLAGEGERVSCVFRTIELKENSLDWLLETCATANALSLDSEAAIAAHQDTFTRLEMEWIRQFWGKGAAHAALHRGWWQETIAHLETIWEMFEQQTNDLIKHCTSAESTTSLVKTVLKALRRRQDLRARWEAFYTSPAVEALPESQRPIVRPSLVTQPSLEMLIAILCQFS